MAKFKIKKGNLYNQLTGQIDKNLLDSNQYDLELKVDNMVKYFRIRLYDSKFVANPIVLDKKQFILPQFSSSCNLNEITNFRTTKFYKKEFKYRGLFESEMRKNNRYKQLYSNLPDYYCYLQRILNKNELSAENIYNFSLPAINERKKDGVLSYDVSIESVKTKYYIVFIKELVEKGYYQGNNSLYMIYDRNGFYHEKSKIESGVSKICNENKYPVTLTELIYIITAGDLCLINEIYNKIEIARSKKDMRTILDSELFKLLSSNIKYNDLLEKEILSYIKGEKEDIEYNFKNKILKK